MPFLMNENIFAVEILFLKSNRVQADSLKEYHSICEFIYYEYIRPLDENFSPQSFPLRQNCEFKIMTDDS